MAWNALWEKNRGIQTVKRYKNARIDRVNKIPLILGLFNYLPPIYGKLYLRRENSYTLPRSEVSDM